MIASLASAAPADCGQYEPVAVLQPRPTDLTLEQPELVAQR